MRLFVAVDLNKEVKDKIKNLQEKLEKESFDLKFVKPENIHITIKFLGEVKEDGIEKICYKLKGISSSFHSFNINVKEVGSFPDWKSPRVLWAGIEEGKKELKELVETTERIFHKDLGFNKEKREFNAHITIARFKSSRNTNKEKLKRILDSSHPEFGVVNINDIILMKSILTLKYPIYDSISCFHLIP